jgi:hypothetical protein
MSALPDPNDIAAAANERIAQLTKEFDAEQRASAAQDAESDAKRAAAARKGELGPEWQKIQQKIDLNKTTLTAVFSGEDSSAEARALTTRSRQNLAKLGEELRDDSEEPDPDNPFVQLQAAAAELNARVAAMRATQTEEL